MMTNAERLKLRIEQINQEIAKLEEEKEETFLELDKELGL